MCGIIGYIGNKEAQDILLDGLESLEYRGYDSSGVYISRFGSVKAVGPVKNLREKLRLSPAHGNAGIAHTRWATHGEPSEANAHPHTGTGKVWAVHNGIIENHAELKAHLITKGKRFSSITDTEVIPQLIEDAIDRGLSFERAVLETLPKLRGTYGLALMHRDHPDEMIAARLGSPLIIGVADDGRYIASDTAPLARHVREVVHMKDGDIAVIKRQSHEVFSIDRERLVRTVESVPIGRISATKDGFSHYMEKEIMEAPEVLRNVIRGRASLDGSVKLGGLEQHKSRLRKASRVILVGCGTSYYAALLGKYLIEDLAHIPVDAEIGSELRYRNIAWTDDTVLIALSQSGETADTLEAVREAKRRGAFTIGIVNVVGSSIARETDTGMHTHAGPEMSVASTKAFISQVAALALLAVHMGSLRDLPATEGAGFISELLALPEKAELILRNKEKIREIAQKHAAVEHALYIGRRYMLPIAYEGALKLKEVSYIHAEAYGAGELKHGPLALVNGSMPVIALAPRDSMYEKTLSNMQEVRARGGNIIAFVTKGDARAANIAQDTIEIPHTDERLCPIIMAIPLHIFAYYTAVERGLDVDRPRNLAKSVTVE